MPDEPVVVEGDTPADSPTGTPTPDGSDASASAPGGATPSADTPQGWDGTGEPPEWVRKRISGESSRRKAAEDAAARASAEVNVLRRQLQALTGATPPAQDDPRHAQIRDELEKIIPGIGKLGDLQKQLEAVNEFMENYWQGRASETMNDAWTRVSEEVGKEFGPTAKRMLHGAFVSFVEEDPDRLARYQNRDKTLIDEFHGALKSELLDPYRQRGTSAAAAKASAVSRLPRQGPGTTLVGGKPKPSFKDFDELAAALEKELGG